MKRFQQSAHALGSTVLLTICLKEPSRAEAVFQELWQYITAFEKRFSRFLPDSELSQFNLRAGAWVTISQPMRQLLQIAKQLSIDTDGLYNPFILPSLQNAGYLGSWPQPDVPAGYDYRQRQGIVPISQLKIKEDTARIPKNSALDFGGIGKGYLLDQLAHLLKQQQIDNFWLSLGGDIIGGGQDIDSQAWVAGVEGTDEKIPLNESYPAVATSGVTKRRGKDWHHIIDPRTGLPAETDLRTASVNASTATQADVLAKCLVILGSAKAPGFAAQYKLNRVLLG